MLIKLSCKYRKVIKEDFNPHSSVSLGHRSPRRGQSLIVSGVYEEDLIEVFIISVWAPPQS